MTLARPWYRRKCIELEAYQRMHASGLTLWLYSVTPVWLALVIGGGALVALVLMVALGAP